MYLGTMVIFEKEKTSIQWKEISQSLRVNEKVFTCLKSAIRYANQTHPTLFIISKDAKTTIPWKMTNSLIKSHLNVSSKHLICSNDAISEPIFPVIAHDPDGILTALESIVHENYIQDCIVKFQGIPYGEGRILLGTSPKMITLYKTILRRSMGDKHCLIYGETGVGKTLTAEALHFYHPERSKNSIESIDIGKVEETLFEACLFGAKKGAYTGCNENKKGFFEKSSDGTLFIDEIGNVSLDNQKKLLEALEKKIFTPLGGHEPRKITARMIFATNNNLRKMVEEKEFMQDLLARIGRLTIHIPPLRDRKEDIPLLATDHINTLNHQYGRSKQITEEALKHLMGYSWPENVRDLHAVLELAYQESTDNNLRVEDFNNIDISKKDLLPEPQVHLISLYSSNNFKNDSSVGLIARTKKNMEERNAKICEIAKGIGMSKTGFFMWFKNPLENLKDLRGISSRYITRLEYWNNTGTFLPLNDIDKIKEIMKAHQLTLQDFSTALKVTRQAVSKWLQKIRVDENGIFSYHGIPQDKAELIIAILKNRPLSLIPSNQKIAHRG
ncbi:MAG: sigma 54-interacting transcriptional regulator [Nitrospiria bacterium]